jgi:FkbM family methyltransferase
MVKHYTLYIAGVVGSTPALRIFNYIMKKYWPKIKRMLKELLALPFATDTRTCFAFYKAIITSIPQIIRDKNFGVPHSKMCGKPCVFKFFGKKILLDGISFGYAGEIYLRKCYTPPEFTIERNDIVVDLGASIGPFTIGAALLGQKVIAVDINQESLEKLKKQAELNRCLNKIKVILGAVGPNSGMCIDQIKKVPALEFNQLLKENDISTVDFLKIDIEGSEFDLLKNNNDWLSKVKKIAMEVHPPYGNPKELKEILQGRGFNVYLKDLNGKIVDNITDVAGGYLFAKRY